MPSGKCIHCGNKISLRGGETKCPSCGGEIQFYCNNCRTPFLVKDTKECSICKWFICPYCESCKGDCEKEDAQKVIESSILMKDKIQEIGYILKQNNPSYCTQRSVPSSYAINMCPAYMKRMENLLSKSESDSQKFKGLYTKYLSKPINESFTINESRDDGRFGNEDRIICYLLVCAGQLKLQRKYSEKYKDYYTLFTRINGEKCPYFDSEWITKLIKYCPVCNEKYSFDNINCKSCIQKKGKNKGRPIILKTDKKTNSIVMMCNNKDFLRNRFIEKIKNE